MAEPCGNIIDQAERGEVEIVTSALATIEVAYLVGHDDEDSELKIQEFFSRPYVIQAAIDVGVADIARNLIRKYREGPKLRSADAAHLATAIQHQIPLVETTDTELLRLNKQEGNPLIVIRKPFYEGPHRMSGF